MRYELYYAGEDLLLDVPENRGFELERIKALLCRLREEGRIDFEVIDVSDWSDAELDRAYRAAVIASVWNRYRIRKVFGTKSASRSFFGRGVPALLVYEGEHPVGVFPHDEEGKGIITIVSYLESLQGLHGPELARQMDESRQAIGPIGVSTSELIREGRRR